MTPEAKDLLRSARATLGDVVLPALGDPFAVEQLRTVLRVLTLLEAAVDEAYPLEHATADDLGAVLDEIARSLPADPALDELRSALERERPAPRREPGIPSLDELRAASSRRKSLIAALIRGPLRERRGSSWETVTRARLADLVRRQLVRERRWMAAKPRAAEEKTP